MSKWPVPTEMLAAQLRGHAEELDEESARAICMQRCADRLDDLRALVVAIEVKTRLAISADTHIARRQILQEIVDATTASFV